MSNYDELTPADGGPEDNRWLDAVRRRVRAPGMLMQIYGVLIVGFFAMTGTLSLVNPAAMVNWQYDFLEDMQKDQPPEQRAKVPPREEAIQSQKIQGPIYAAVWIAAGVVIFIGGSKMKELRGYGWSLAGSIVSLFPGACCCCTGLVPGLWALVVLLNPDVKLGFSRNTGGGDQDVPFDSRLE